MKLLDTTYLIDLLKGDKRTEVITELLDESGLHATSTINVHEYLVGGFGSNSEKELQIRKAILNKLVILSFDRTSAEISAEIEANLRSQGKFIGTPDVMISAIMKRHGIVEIVTRNSRHFKQIDGIQIVEY